MQARLKVEAWQVREIETFAALPGKQNCMVHRNQKLESKNRGAWGCGAVACDFPACSPGFPCQVQLVLKMRAVSMT